MMEQYILRFVFAALAAGGVGIFTARIVSHWTDQDPWTIRIACYVLIALGIVGLAACLSPIAALKAFGIAIVLCPIMAWIDVVAERKEAELAEERMQRFVTPRHGRRNS